MPPTFTYPGVYVEEIPSGVHTIIGVATSITAFVGRAAWGEVNKPITINSWGDYQRLFGGLSPLSTMSYLVSDFYQHGGSQAVIVRIANGGAPATLALAENLSPPSPPSTPGGPPFEALYLQAQSVGSWGNLLTAQVDLPKAKPASDDPKLFNLTVKLWDPTKTRVVIQERYAGISVDPNSATYVARVLSQQSNLVEVAQIVGGADEVPLTAPAETPPVTKETPLKYPQDGVDDGPIGTADFIGGDSQSSKTGLYALEQVDLFNLLVIPPFVNASGGTGDITSDVQAAASEYCEKRRAFFIIDSPATWKNKQNALDGLDGFTGNRSLNSALFFPRLMEPNLLHNGNLEEVVPSGAIAGLFAQTDVQRGVWKAPAGIEVGFSGNVQDFTVSLTDDENGELNPLGVNCLRFFHIIGRVVWGSRTLQGADELTSEWKYIPIRRLTLFLEESLYRGTKWVVFEPNDEPLWAQIRLNVNSFMQGLFLQGAFAGQKASDAYRVKCDKENNPQESIDQGIVNILVAFAPLEPAEFVVIQIQQLSGQSQS